MPTYATAEATPAVATAPHSRPRLAGQHPVSTEDDLLAAILITTWSLAAGRHLRSDVRPEQLSEEELIEFWADDLDAG